MATRSKRHRHFRQTLPGNRGAPHYAGGYHDTQTGHTKFGTRYYDPILGRWTQQDPLSGWITQPGTLNRYAYVGGDPINYVDPTGYWWERALVSFGGAPVLAGTTCGALAAATGGVAGAACGIAAGTAVGALPGP